MSLASSDSIIQHLRDLHDELNRIPTPYDLSNEDGLDPETVFQEYGDGDFIGWDKALVTAEIIDEPDNWDEWVPTVDIVYEINHYYYYNPDQDHPPALYEMSKTARRPATVYIDRFGKWNTVLNAAQVPQRRNIPDIELTRDLQRVAAKLDKPPTKQEYAMHGAYSAKTYSRFGTWNDALHTADLPAPAGARQIPEEDLIAELQRLYNELDRAPTVTDLDQHGRYSRSPYRDRWGDWNDALKAADIEPRITDEKLITEIRRLHDKLDRVPQVEDIRNRSRYSYNAYLNRWDDINGIREAAKINTE